MCDMITNFVFCDMMANYGFSASTQSNIRNVYVASMLHTTFNKDTFHLSFTENKIFKITH